MVKVRKTKRRLERNVPAAGDRNRREAFCRCLTTLLLLSGLMEEETVCAVPISRTAWFAWDLTRLLLNLRMAIAEQARSSTSAIHMRVARAGEVATATLGCCLSQGSR